MVTARKARATADVNATLERLDQEYRAKVLDGLRSWTRQEVDEDAWQEALIVAAEMMKRGRWKPETTAHEFRLMRMLTLQKHRKVSHVVFAINDELAGELIQQPVVDDEATPCVLIWYAFRVEVEKLSRAERSAMQSVVDAWQAGLISYRDALRAHSPELLAAYKARTGRSVTGPGFADLVRRGKRKVWAGLRASGFVRGEMPKRRGMPDGILI